MEDLFRDILVDVFTKCYKDAPIKERLRLITVQKNGYYSLKVIKTFFILFLLIIAIISALILYFFNDNIFVVTLTISLMALSLFFSLKLSKKVEFNSTQIKKQSTIIDWKSVRTINYNKTYGFLKINDDLNSIYVSSDSIGLVRLKNHLEKYTDFSSKPFNNLFHKKKII